MQKPGLDLISTDVVRTARNDSEIVSPDCQVFSAPLLPRPGALLSLVEFQWGAPGSGWTG